MVTAILPSLTMQLPSATAAPEIQPEEPVQPLSAYDNVRNSGAFSISSELTITPARYISRPDSPRIAQDRPKRTSRDSLGSPYKPSVGTGASSQLAGYVGMFTGIGALLAVALFLPLPATMSGNGTSKKAAVKDSFYIVASVALAVGILVFFGLRGLPGDEGKGFRNLYAPAAESTQKHDFVTGSTAKSSYRRLATEAVVLAFTDSRIALGYTGGLVARASSVAISLFIPLFVNAYFISEGLCTEDPGDDMKSSCRRAYTLASMLTGFAELAALLCAPIFGWFDSRMSAKGALSNVPLGLGAIAGIVGSLSFAMVRNPDPFSGNHRAKWVVFSVILLGVSQISAIVCSLGSLAKGIHEAGVSSGIADSEASVHPEQDTDAAVLGGNTETAPLIASSVNYASAAGPTGDRTHLKGTIAGVYSLLGGVGILILTKVGGVLFDKSSGAPFLLLAGFNGLLLASVLVAALRQRVRTYHRTSNTS